MAYTVCAKTSGFSDTYSCFKSCPLHLMT